MEDLKKQRENHTTKIFLLGLQTAFIFAIPAIMGAIIGTKLDAFYETGSTITIATLIVTFVLSWCVVLMRYFQLQKKLKEINQAIKENSESNI